MEVQRGQVWSWVVSWWSAWVRGRVVDEWSLQPAPDTGHVILVGDVP